MLICNEALSDHRIGPRGEQAPHTAVSQTMSRFQAFSFPPLRNVIDDLHNHFPAKQEKKKLAARSPTEQ